MSPPPSASAIGCRLPSTAPPHTPRHGARARCWRRRRRLLPLERVVVVRGGVGVVAVPPPPVVVVGSPRRRHLERVVAVRAHGIGVDAIVYPLGVGAPRGLRL